MTSTEEFQVQSFIGSDIAQMKGCGGERPPKSAQLVASLDMGSGPGGGDYRTYLLEGDSKRLEWTLWQKGSDCDTGKPLYCRVAFGSSRQPTQPEYAAEQLLMKVWEDERDWGYLGHSVGVEAAGILTDEDIKRIALKVFDI